MISRRYLDVTHAETAKYGNLLDFGFLTLFEKTNMLVKKVSLF